MRRGMLRAHNGHLLRGRTWGSFLDVRTNAAESYLDNYESEARWARQPSKRDGRDGLFSIFCSSSTDPFVPQERRFRITRSVLEAMCRRPPDRLILQTHTHLVAEDADVLCELSQRCDLRVHVSIETDRERIDGLPPHASPVEKRFAACARLKDAGLWTVVTVAPLLPIAEPNRFFARIAEVADAVVLDHYIGGDGSADGSPRPARRCRRRLPTSIPRLSTSPTATAWPWSPANIFRAESASTSTALPAGTPNRGVSCQLALFPYVNRQHGQASSMPHVLNALPPLRFNAARDISAGRPQM